MISLAIGSNVTQRKKCYALHQKCFDHVITSWIQTFKHLLEAVIFPQVEAATQQAPPDQVPPPTVLFYNSTVVHLSWTAPAVPNGIIERYVVYDTAVPSAIVVRSGADLLLLITGK